MRKSEDTSLKLVESTFKAAIEAGRPMIGIWTSLSSGLVADILGTTGFDWALADMEHSAGPDQTLPVNSAGALSVGRRQGAS
jgi:2-keto-3-deoxy-L-rhamnonate aldolase RhmA